MSAARTAAVVAALVVFGGWATWRAVRPKPLTIAAIRSRYPRAVQDRGGTAGVDRLAHRLAAGPAGVWVERHLALSLRLTGLTVPAVLARIVTVAAVALVSMLLAIAALIAVGVAAPSVWWLVLVLVVPALLVARVVSQIHTTGLRLHRELRRVINDFVQLVAVALTTNRSVEEAIDFASEAGTGAGFELLRETVVTARPMGIAVWDALATMAATYDLPELAGISGSLQRQAGIGVSVAATVRTEAAALRRQQLDELTERADQANANLSLPTMGIVLGMVLFLAYPIAQQITTAFT